MGSIAAPGHSALCVVTQPHVAYFHLLIPFCPGVEVCPPPGTSACSTSTLALPALGLSHSLLFNPLPTA